METKDWYGIRQTFSNSEELVNWFARREFLDENDKPRGLIKIVIRPPTESREKWSVTCTFKKLGYPIPSDKDCLGCFRPRNECICGRWIPLKE